MGKENRRADAWPETIRLCTHFLFPKMILHVENLGGEIDKVASRRCVIAAFPFKFDGGESAYCRVVAFVSE
jgi:arylformamidase